MDDEQADAAGRPAVRPRVELGARTAGRTGRASCPVPLIYPETPGVDSYKDLQPRMSATYDLFGNGKTALKANVGKYLEATITASNYGIANPTSRIISNVVAELDRHQRQLHPGLRSAEPGGAGSARAAAATSAAPSRTRTSARTCSATRSIPAILKGWGVRPSDWAFGVSVQHEVLPRVSIEVGYVRRWFQGFIATDNLAVVGVRLRAVQRSRRRLDSRLPGGGGQTIGPLYDVNPAHVRPDQQLHHVRRQLRHAVSAVQRDRLQRQRADDATA